MKKIIITLIMAFVLVMSRAACGGNDPSEEATSDTTEEIAAEEAMTAGQTPEYTDFSYVKELSSETGFGMDVNAVLLTPEGRAVMRTEGELGQAIGWEVELADGVSDIYVEPFGNGGFYAILLLKPEGTVSEVNASALINDKKVEIIDRLGAFNDVKLIEGVKEEDAYSINAILSNGDKEPLDEYLK